MLMVPWKACISRKRLTNIAAALHLLVAAVANVELLVASGVTNIVEELIIHSLLVVESHYAVNTPIA